MTETTTDAPSRAARTRGWNCQHRTIRTKLKELSQPQKDALHAFREKVASAMEEFYGHVPAPVADPILNIYFKDPPQSKAADRIKARTG